MKRVEIDKLDIEKRKTTFDKYILGYTKSEIIKEAKRCLNCQNPKCKEGCPINNRIPEFIHEVANDNIEGAYQILQDNTVLPEICGIVCPHEKQCQGSCIKGLKGDSLAIGAIESYIGEYIRINGLDDLNKQKNSKTVAIIGSGPAGMSAAYYLAKKGYDVTIYEKENYLGGVLTWGIPSFRLDKKIVQDYFERLKKLDVNLITNTNIGKDITLEELKNKYDYVIIAVGALIPNKMHIIGEELPFVFQANNFLKELSFMNKKELSECTKYGKKIIVVGGGNVAIDSARSAVRLPGVENVTVLYRRSQEEMPASKEELNDAIEEGVVFKYLTNPVSIKDNHTVECALMELLEKDETGRRRPIETNENHLILEADTIIMALGFNNDPNAIGNTNIIEKDKYNRIIVDENYKTNVNNIYAVGDSVTGASTVVNAMKEALIASKDIENNMKCEYSAGAVLYRNNNGVYEYLIVKDRNDNYAFSKGHIDKDETKEECAKREIKEEVGLDVDIDNNYCKEIKYLIKENTTKSVTYFMAEFKELKPFINDGEIKEIKILKYDEAYDLLTYDQSKEILKEVNNKLMNK